MHSKALMLPEMWNGVFARGQRIALVLVVALIAQAGVAADVTTLKPHKVLDLETELPPAYANRTTIHAFQASANFLWFLISPLDFLPQILLRIDKKSGASRLTEVGDRQRFSAGWLQVDASENVYLLRSGRERDTIAVFGPDGVLNREVAVDGRAISYAILAGGFISATYEGVVRIHSSDGRVRNTLQAASGRADVWLISLPDGRVVGLDRHDGMGYSIGVKQDALSPFRLESEEIDTRRALEDRQLLIVPSLTVDSEGSLWSSISHVRLIEGAIVVKSAGDGHLLRSYRCFLPQTARTIDADGLMGPHLIASDGRTLYLASSSGMVALYSVPE